MIDIITPNPLRVMSPTSLRLHVFNLKSSAALISIRILTKKCSSFQHQIEWDIKTYFRSASIWTVLIPWPTLLKHVSISNCQCRSTHFSFMRKSKYVCNVNWLRWKIRIFLWQALWTIFCSICDNSYCNKQCFWFFMKWSFNLLSLFFMNNNDNVWNKITMFHEYLNHGLFNVYKLPARLFLTSQTWTIMCRVETSRELYIMLLCSSFINVSPATKMLSNSVLFKPKKLFVFFKFSLRSSCAVSRWYFYGGKPVRYSMIK